MNNTAYINPTSKRSPFAAFPNERLNVVNADNIRPAWHTELADLDKLVLISVNQMLITTSQLLYSHLLNLGLQNTEKAAVNQSLKRLSETGYLTKMEFSSSAGTALYKVYTLSESGQSFIRQIGQRCLMSGYIAQMDAAAAKRQLSAHQFVVGQGYSKTATSIIAAKTVCQKNRPVDSQDDTIFRAQAVVQLPSETILVDSVRNYQGSTDDLIRKLDRIDLTLRRHDLNIPVNNCCSVVILCESYDHMLSVMRRVAAFNRHYHFRLTFSNDIDAFDHPQNCLYSIQHTQPPRKRFSDLLHLRFGGVQQ